MNIVFLGSGEFGIPCLDALLLSKHQIRFVVTQPPNPAGRGRKLNPTPVANWAQAASVPYWETADVNTPEALTRISDHAPDLIVVIAFGQKIGQTLINLPPHRAINVHASLLPGLRGAAPINWAIINKEKVTGVSIITLADKMDAGDVLAQSETPIAPQESAGELHDRLGQISAPLLLATIDRIDAGTATFAPQDHALATFAAKLKKSDGFLDFQARPEDICARIRGFWPWPGASALFVCKDSGKSVRVTIAQAEPVVPTDEQERLSGEFDRDLYVRCGSGALRIEKIKPAGSALMDFKDFVNGRKIEPGDVLRTLAQGSSA
jgi:methionyl-tRNA formyltransferase